ncbi:hypothetical protein ElyMa_000974600 [Elysia marginata]|uniref:Uncharacterized protein n=1 Tax=Elysia marginata TaxID=1093978 RepID=A0AAV4HGT5_9GAST|nr:hypothetical protein ElyMa_000974600 [Elysia marginata]
MLSKQARRTPRGWEPDLQGTGGFHAEQADSEDTKRMGTRPTGNGWVSKSMKTRPTGNGGEGLHAEQAGLEDTKTKRMGTRPTGNGWVSC